jgi:hypothetical protein
MSAAGPEDRSPGIGQVHIGLVVLPDQTEQLGVRRFVLCAGGYGQVVGVG